ncbi:2OG-Fe(II) oxygenase family protein [Micromonospora sp. CPCC 206060]|uniref:2OG-Fe(II) oxygenase family protein n=1 Tax=Micromonospora sp. CPCC 206060 TaxID=3122406 RepID=UPI002FF10F20
MEIGLVDTSSDGAAVAFSRSMHDTGFAVLVNHGIDGALIRRVYDEWLDFFGSGAKHSYRATGGSQDGYFPSLPEDRAAGRDIKEYFQIRPDGRYPNELSSAAQDYYEQAAALAVRLLGWLDTTTPRPAVAHLPVPLAAMLTGSTGSTLRVQHYLPIPPDERPNPIRALAHTDLNLLTVLPSPTGPGLQVRDVRGEWHDVPCDSGAIIINGGEMLELATRQHYPATEHRVVNYDDALHRGSRMSLPLFLHPASAVILAEGCTAADFLRRRVAELRAMGWRPVPGGDD